jgi:hypothetical protein
MNDISTMKGARHDVHNKPPLDCLSKLPSISSMPIHKDTLVARPSPTTMVTDGTTILNLTAACWIYDLNMRYIHPHDIFADAEVFVVPGYLIGRSYTEYTVIIGPEYNQALVLCCAFSGKFGVPFRLHRSAMLTFMIGYYVMAHDDDCYFVGQVLDDPAAMEKYRQTPSTLSTKVVSLPPWMSSHDGQTDILTPDASSVDIDPTLAMLEEYPDISLHSKQEIITKNGQLLGTKIVFERDGRHFTYFFGEAACHYMETKVESLVVKSGEYFERRFVLLSACPKAIQGSEDRATSATALVDERTGNNTENATFPEEDVSTNDASMDENPEVVTSEISSPQLEIENAVPDAPFTMDCPEEDATLNDASTEDDSENVTAKSSSPQAESEDAVPGVPFTMDTLFNSVPATNPTEATSKPNPQALDLATVEAAIKNDTRVEKRIGSVTISAEASSKPKPRALDLATVEAAIKKDNQVEQKTGYRMASQDLVDAEYIASTATRPPNTSSDTETITEIDLTPMIVIHRAVRALAADLVKRGMSARATQETSDQVDQDTNGEGDVDTNSAAAKVAEVNGSVNKEPKQKRKISAAQRKQQFRSNRRGR